jgi:hypothetical protein
MKILIYGAGVQGSLYGARLFEAGHDVTLLARGSRLADLRAPRIILEDRISKRCTVTRLPIVDPLSPGDKYDLAMVPVRREQIGDVFPSLSAARDIRSDTRDGTSPCSKRSKIWWIEDRGCMRLASWISRCAVLNLMCTSNNKVRSPNRDHRAFTPVGGWLHVC